jgi:hypothetical protein
VTIYGTLTSANVVVELDTPSSPTVYAPWGLIAQKQEQEFAGQLS